MIGDMIGLLVLVGLALWFCRFTAGDPLGWAWEQVKAGWKGIGK